ncbi:histidine phosphatase family protein [Marinicella sp. S1101]|uniref:histidine phosphatase family protein n=1 Tax=Marinicella marina TaxID=2996016 RepID=UPI002261003C|nr:histidine phosphatase family protein [Marinicella marina]MCX7554822.1 histidine phosphatase family protein [Marinicella marina]MDJ1140945.1 histidine phosphatase family protein [Marinicella marina]
MNKVLVLLVVMIVISPVISGKTVYLTRHAEKANDGSKDPVLTALGQQRAENLADMLSAANIEHIYATNYQRTQLTAKPLATYLGTTVKTYDASDLTAFAAEIKKQKGNALIVGHSNTTPMLTHMLSNKPVFNLDESDFDNLFQVVFSADEARLNVLKSLPSKATQTRQKLTPMNEHFFTGELIFNMKYKGDVVGQSKHQFEAQGDVYALQEHTRIADMEIDAVIKATVSKENLQPMSLFMNGSMGSPVDIELMWQDQLVTGHSEIPRDKFKQQGKISLNRSLSAHTLERTSTLMLAHMMPVKADQPLLINWFNGYDGDQRLIDISYQGEEQVTVPAGTFETYKIKYAGGAPSQYFWIDKKQAKVVKIEVIYSPWLFELQAHNIN